MTKTRKLKLTGFMCILSFALVFIVLNSLQAVEQGKGKPPGKGKPGDVNWGVQIPETSHNMYGKEPGYIYWNNDGDIEVDVVKSRHPSKEKIPHYIFQLRLSNEENWAGFQNVYFYDYDPESPDPDNPSCIFPVPCDGLGAPECMECFLEGQHPRAGYQQLRISFAIHDYEIEDMTVGVPYQAIHELDTISISVWYSSDCFQPYHNLSNWVRPATGLFIERMAENRWKISVRQPLNFRETYCEEVPTGKGNKTKQVIYTPLIATGDFDFEMDWIK
jgi:hypothetical protein